MRISYWSSDVCSSDRDGERRAPERDLHGLDHLLDVVTEIGEIGLQEVGDEHRHVAGVGDEEGPVVDLDRVVGDAEQHGRSEEHTSELQSLMRISYAVFCLKKKKNKLTKHHKTQ